MSLKRINFIVLFSDEFLSDGGAWNPRGGIGNDGAIETSDAKTGNGKGQFGKTSLSDTGSKMFPCIYGLSPLSRFQMTFFFEGNL